VSAPAARPPEPATLELLLARAASDLADANSRIEQLVSRGIQIVGFAGFTLPILGGLVPDAFATLDSPEKGIAIALYLASLALLSLTIALGVLGVMFFSSGRHLAPGTYDQLAEARPEAGQLARGLVEAYETLRRLAEGAGRDLADTLRVIAVAYVLGLVLAVGSLATITVGGGF
jgi:hypothetical protein